ncbi:hypothetical protein GcM3_029024, partial [Golovinomyces cichoracearum]
MDRGDGRDVLDDDSVDDNTHTAGSRPSSEKNEHLKSSDPPVTNIHAFSGQPPLDPNFYIELLSRVKVPLSVLEIAQISPEAALNWKRLMTRENSRKKKNAAMEGNSVKVENNLLEELYSFLEKRAESNKILVNSNGKQCHPLHSTVYSTNISKSSTQNNLLADRPFRVPVIVNAYKLGRLFH